MNEQLQTALMLLLRRQDRDTVNDCFTRGFHSQVAADQEPTYCRVDLQRGTVNLHDSETGEEVGFVKFSINIQEIK